MWGGMYMILLRVSFIHTITLTITTTQAAIQLRDYVDRAANKYSHEEYPSMQQKIHYLTTLFDMMIKEESTLLETIDATTFFDTLITAEVCLWEGIELERANNHTEALERYKTALDSITTALHGSTTKLLNTILSQLYEKRAVARLQLESYKEALQDADAMLTVLDAQGSGKAHVLRAKALEGMNKMEQAKEALAAAVLVNPQDEALRAQLERLSVQEI